MKTQEEWIEDLLGSLNGMSRAQAPAGMHSKILARLSALPKRQVIPMPRRSFWLMAAGLLLLIGTNLYVIKGTGDRSGDRLVRKAGDNPIGAEYFAPTPSI